MLQLGHSAWQIVQTKCSKSLTKEGSGCPARLQPRSTRHHWLWLLLTGAGPTLTTADTALPASASHGQEQGAGHQRQDPRQRLQGLSQALWVGNVFRARAHYLPRLGLHHGGAHCGLCHAGASHFSEEQHNPCHSLQGCLVPLQRALRPAPCGPPITASHLLYWLGHN